MRWKLFLDDVRYPPDKEFVAHGNEWVVARSYDDAVWCIENYGIPYHISFDHDLASEHYIIGGGEKDGYQFAKWFSDYVLLGEYDLPEDFSYNVHSMNPVGSKRIKDWMEDFFRAYREQT